MNSSFAGLLIIYRVDFRLLGNRLGVSSDLIGVQLSLGRDPLCLDVCLIDGGVEVGSPDRFSGFLGHYFSLSVNRVVGIVGVGINRSLLLIATNKDQAQESQHAQIDHV